MRCVAVLLIACLVGFAGAGCAEDRPEIRIGFLATDLLTEPGAMGLRGVRLAVGRLSHNGGLFGRSLTVVPVACGSDRQGAVEAALDLCTIEGVKAIVSTLPTSLAKAVAPVCQERQVALILTEALGRGIEDWGDCIFRLRPDDTACAAAAVDLLATEGRWLSPLLVTDSAEAGASFAVDAYRAELAERGRTFVGAVSFDRADTTGAVSRAAATRCDGIIFAGACSSAAAFISALRAAGLQQPVCLAGGCPCAPVQAAVAAAAAAGGEVIVCSGADPASPTAARQQFAADARREDESGPPVDEVAVRCHDAVSVLVSAARTAGATKVDAVVAALAGLKDWQGASGCLSYDAKTRAPLFTPLHVLVISTSGVRLLTGLDSQPLP
jgi:branched-chain amino acid transport system substrate-binding protein